MEVKVSATTEVEADTSNEKITSKSKQTEIQTKTKTHLSKAEAMLTDVTGIWRIKQIHT